MKRESILRNSKSAKRALNRLIPDFSWGELKLKIYSVAEKFGCIVLEINPKFTSQTCSHCGNCQVIGCSESPVKLTL